MFRILLFILLSTFGLFSCSQQKSPIASQLENPPEIRTQEQVLKLKDNDQTAHTMVFVSDESTTLSAWRSFAKEELKQKLEKSKGKYVAENVMISRISSGPISLYSHVEKKSDGSQLQVWVKSGEEFVSHSNNQDIAQRIDEVMRNFANKFYGKHYQMAITNQEESRADLAKELSSLEKTRKSIEKSLEENKEELDENQEEIKELQEKIDKLQAENDDLTKTNKELEKEQKENKKAIEEQEKKVQEKEMELEKLKANSKDYK